MLDKKHTQQEGCVIFITRKVFIHVKLQYFFSFCDDTAAVPLPSRYHLQYIVTERY